MSLIMPAAVAAEFKNKRRPESISVRTVLDNLIVFKFAAGNITGDAAVMRLTAFLSEVLPVKSTADAVGLCFYLVVMRH